MEHIRRLGKHLDAMSNDTLLDIFSDNQSESANKLMSSNTSKTVVLLVSFGALVIVSLFSNILVCHVICKKKTLMTVTNIFIANMALSDLLLVTLNVPLNVTRNIMDDWIFGNFLCHCVNFSLMVSVYVSTFTLTSIALDRQRVLIYPLHPRITKKTAIMILVLIWTLSGLLSLPYGLFNHVVVVNLLDNELHRRCTPGGYPEPPHLWKRYLTLATFLVQYLVPLLTIAITYSRIVHNLWLRTHLGVLTETQRILQIQNKRKSIKLLVAVVIVFAVCWMPLNIYHILAELYPNPHIFPHQSVTFFVCHWIAISSTCINPILYCYINPSFRAEVRARFMCCIKSSGPTHSSEVELDDLLTKETLFKHRRYTLNSSTSDSRKVEKEIAKEYPYRFIHHHNGHLQSH